MHSKSRKTLIGTYDTDFYLHFVVIIHHLAACKRLFRLEIRNLEERVGSLMAELDTRESKSADEFDPDAAIARYLANRPAEQPVAAPQPQRPAVQGFGRKRA